MDILREALNLWKFVIQISYYYMYGVGGWAHGFRTLSQTKKMFFRRASQGQILEHKYQR